MSFPALYREPVLLDRQQHRGKRLRRNTVTAPVARLHACFLAVSEFPEASKDFVIGFVDASAPDAAGPKEVSPIALLGLREDENLYVVADAEANGAGSRWDARYLPAFIRRYPFAYGRGDDGQPAVLIDAACEGLNDIEGELLVQDDGEPTPFLQQMIQFLDAFEEEVQRTRLLCQRIVELDLLKPVQIDVSLPGGQTLNAGGVQVIDEAKLKALPEAVAVELLRNGALGLLHAHLISTTNVQRLTERLGERMESEKT